MKDSVTTVAPREIVDYVFRVARLAGADAASADVIARNVRFAEVVYGEAVTHFLQTTATDGFASGPYVTGPIEFAGAESRLADEPGSASSHEFSVPVPRSAIAREIYDAQQRGVWVVGTERSPEVIDEVELRRGDVDDDHRRQINERLALAGIHGVSLHDATFTHLTELAKPYLVSEALLDANVPEGPTNG